MNHSTSDFAKFLPSFWTKSLKKAPLLCPRYEIIDLNNEFIHFIESDGLILDDDTFVSSFSSDDDFSDNETDAHESYIKPSEAFPLLHANIKHVFESLGGSVVPKLNWTVPKVYAFCCLYCS